MRFCFSLSEVLYLAKPSGGVGRIYSPQPAAVGRALVSGHCSCVRLSAGHEGTSLLPALRCRQ